MTYTKEEIENMDSVLRLKIVNLVTGIKPASVIGTLGSNGNTYLSIFSYIVHLGSSPALLGLTYTRQYSEFGHSYSKIKENEVYTINHIHPGFIKNEHYTSAKFSRDISEFERCKLTEEYSEYFKVPFVNESEFKIGMRFQEMINNTVLIIGEIDHITLPDEYLVDGDVNLELSNEIGISGLNSYYKLKKLDSFPHINVKYFPKIEK